MRDLNKVAWFLYQVTSIEYFERCAQACQDFAEIYDRLMTKHDVHGYANLDYWVEEYYRYAKEIRRRAEMAKLGDYMPILSTLNGAAASYRGFSEQPDGWMTKEEKAEWLATFERLSTLCSASNEAMRNNEWAGLYWLNREEHKHEQELVDRDDGISSENCEWYINDLQENNLLPTPAHYPQYRIDKSRSCRAGETSPWTGVWIPEQALTEGLDKLSLAFAQAGRPMQPAYRIVKDAVELVPTVLIEGDRETLIWPEEPGETDYARHIETKAEDALWYPVVEDASVSVAAVPPDHGRLKGYPNAIVPKTGWWGTPALKEGAWRYFEQGEHFPATHTTSYGSVIWSYDPTQQQEPPKK